MAMKEKLQGMFLNTPLDQLSLFPSELMKGAPLHLSNNDDDLAESECSLEQMSIDDILPSCTDTAVLW
jgi:hypothetical protein